MTIIHRVTTLADLPADVRENVENWSGTGDGHPLSSEDGERGVRLLTGYAEVGTTTDGWRLFILRFDTSTFTYAYMSPRTTSMTVGSRNDHMTKTAAEFWAAEQLTLDLAPATDAGVRAYNIGRPSKWQRYVPDGWGAVEVLDPGMVPVVEGKWGLSRDRLGRAFVAAWDDNAAHDSSRDTAPRGGFKPGPNQVGSQGITDSTGRMVWSWAEPALVSA